MSATFYCWNASSATDKETRERHEACSLYIDGSRSAFSEALHDLWRNWFAFYLDAGDLALLKRRCAAYDNPCKETMRRLEFLIAKFGTVEVTRYP